MQVLDKGGSGHPQVECRGRIIGNTNNEMIRPTKRD
jgi:hypothetical protein